MGAAHVKAISEAPDAQVAVMAALPKRIRGNWVLIDPQIKTRVGLIELPQESQKKATSGVVVLVGPGRATDSGFLRPMDVSVGERVFFAQHAKSHILRVKGHTYYQVDENDILGVVDGDHDIKVGTTDV